MSFERPYVIDDATAAFPATVAHLMPRMEDIPEEFHRYSKWNKFQFDWFFTGLKSENLIPREGIDKALAFRHLAAVQYSFEPKHEHKMAAVAYLASLWFTDESTWEKNSGD